MFTTQLDTTVAERPLTPPPLWAAHGLPSQQRQALALQGLAGTQPISTLSARQGVSRKFVYQQMRKVSEALEHAFDVQVLEEAVLFYITLS
ncbi:MAG: hypothetical protein WA970_24750 [Gammaproteobacteria bacterium]